jgi:glutamine synthetase
MKTVSDYFGELVFDDRVMRQMLPADVYASLKKTIDEGVDLNENVANSVATAMKDWAISKGATHFTHWFQPLTGITAEKHDSFISPTPNGGVLMEFSGKELIKGEPDASSFPSGGLRATFEARGYTAWDPTSYAFIKDKTLCIPTAFCSYSGDALDKKTPLLRSMEALNKQALRILRLFGNNDVKCVRTSVGPEQEYFLIDKQMLEKREDLKLCGRTLFGAKPPKGQELDDHYFGVIKPRVAAFMAELNTELWKLGILAKTEHNEVAPAQHELAPIYSTTNVATDHNQLTMEIMKKVADRHGLVCLLHEKPFAGVNGSGKHNNWSMATDTGVNLLTPGETPYENAQFLLFLCAVIKAVDDYQDLLRLSVATAGNDHRLGANEAPPAVVSMFVGDELAAILSAIENDEPYAGTEKTTMKLGVSVLPKFFRDTTDRNRTSPFAFTGNRFELRAVGSSANCSSAVSVLNTIVAYQLKRYKEGVDRRVSSGTPMMKALLDETRETYRACQKVCFEGNGYSDEWKAEAARRGLDCETSVPLAYDVLNDPRTVELYRDTGVMTESELRARSEISWEIYSKKVEIEARVLADLTANHILPVATRYQSVLLDNVSKMKDIFEGEEFDEVASGEIRIIKDIACHISKARSLAADMEADVDEICGIEGERAKAIAFHDRVLPYLERVREHVDALEMIVDDQMWPLPKYRELLFIR